MGAWKELSKLYYPPTARQLEIFNTWIKSGGSQKEAAYELGISIKTVKNQMTDLYYRLEVSSNIEACIKLGYLRIPD